MFCLLMFMHLALDNFIKKKKKNLHPTFTFYKCMHSLRTEPISLPLITPCCLCWVTRMQEHYHHYTIISDNRMQYLTNQNSRQTCNKSLLGYAYFIPGLSEFFQNPRTVLVSSPSEPALHLSTGPAAFFAQAVNICLIRDEESRRLSQEIL